MFVLGLIALTVAILIGLAGSHDFAWHAARLLAGNLSADGQIKVELTGFSGSLASGFKIDTINVKKLNPPSEIVINDLMAGIDFDRLFKAGVISVVGRTGDIEIKGFAPVRLPIMNVPAYSGPACFAGLPANVEIASFAIPAIKFTPWSEQPAEVHLTDIRITPGSLKTEQDLSFDAHASWRSRQIGAAKLVGKLKQRQRRFEGRAEVCFAGQKLSTELCLTTRRNKPDLSGYIASASIDIARLSHWLSPLWQDNFPFGFDGGFDCSGSWLYNAEMGFLGNLSGSCRQLRMVALGLYVTIFELNGSWKLYDGNLLFADSGSSFAGFPAALSGQIDAVMSPARKWNLSFNCPAIDFARLAADLPWGVKYSADLPELSGLATLSVQITGKAPGMTAKLSTDGLVAGKNSQQRVVTGNMVFLHANPGSSTVELALTATAQHSLPAFFKRFHGGGDTLFNLFSRSGGPFAFSYSLKGPPLHDLAFEGVLLADEECLFRTTGHWRNGIGSARAFPEQAGSQHGGFAAGGIQLLDLLLVR